MSTVATRGPTAGVRAPCTSLGVAPATNYRARRTRALAPRPAPSRTFTPAQRQQVLAQVRELCFIDCAPALVYATLLDEGTNLYAERTMHRVLAKHVQVMERRAQRRHAVCAKPELLATVPLQLRTWDITKLRGPQPGTWYQLYAGLDVLSRYLVGWRVAPRESTALLDTCCYREGIARDRLTVKADRDTAVLSRCLTQLLVGLGVAKANSRPHVSTDDPYSEAQLPSQQYHPIFPERFGSVESARVSVLDFFHWYNTEHGPSGLGLHTHYGVHTGRAPTRQVARQWVVTAYYAAYSERFVRRQPTHAALPTAVGIHTPQPAAATVALRKLLPLGVSLSLTGTAPPSPHRQQS